MTYFLDFDDTAFFTSEKSPQGMTVPKAYWGAIRSVFGDEAADVFQSEGLRSRAPIEIVTSLMNACSERTLLANAHIFYQKNKHRFENHAYIPVNKGGSLGNDLTFMVEMLVFAKLQRLHSELGSRFPNDVSWPAPCAGFEHFMDAVAQNNRQKDRRDKNFIHIAVISSGHDIFIRRCFKKEQFQVPQTMVTDDDMRTVNLKSMELKRKVKPGTFGITTLHSRLFKLLNGRRPATGEDLQKGLAMKQDMVLIGDSLEKDGGLAANYGIRFLLYDPDRKHPGLNHGNASFHHWSDLANLLHKHGPRALLNANAYVV